MGNQRSSEYLATTTNNERKVFVSFVSYKSWPAESYSARYDAYTFLIKYQRYRWTISKRFSEIMSLDSDLYDEFTEKIDLVKRPRKYAKIFWTHNNDLLTRRANDIVVFLQTLVDDKEVFQSRILKEFLEIGETSLRPQLGRKGKEGYLRKCSGGYLQNYSSRTGDFIKTWRKRWFVLHDTYIAYYKNAGDIYPLGCFQIDPKFHVAITGRIVTISNRTRRLVVFGSSQRVAVEWAEACSEFYSATPRKYVQLFGSSYPPRPSTSVRLYVCGKEYFTALAVALLQAKEEILIASWMVSPTLLLTRPPLPPLRLDQLLKYKAERGVKIYVLLYKEVELSGLGNDSLKCRTHLEALSPNISVMRHPNKLLGGSTAILWSHHEKLVIIDRAVSFIGGIDPCFGRWDDEHHVLTDEDGVLFPGKDYYQPARGLFKPAQEISDEFLDGVHYAANCADNDEEDEDEVVDDNASVDINEFEDGDKYSEASSAPSESSWTADEEGASRLPKTQVKSNKELTAEEIRVLERANEDITMNQEQSMCPENVVPPAPYDFVPAAPSTFPAPSAPPPLPPDKPQQPMVFTVNAVSVNTPSTASPPTFHVTGSVLVPSQTTTQTATVVTAAATPQLATVVSDPSRSRPESACTNQQPLTASALAFATRRPPSNRSYTSTKSSGASSLYATSTANHTSPKSFSIQSMMDSIQMFQDSMAGKMERIRNEKKKERVDEHQARELFPRMPWHDVHACVTGLPARDLSAHFVQRWNHHRVSKGQTNVAILTDVTDNPHFSMCARCDTANLYETVTECPVCNYDLGPAKKSLTYRDYAASNTKDDALEGAVGSYVAYECYFSSQLGCRIQGDGPTLVTLITNSDTVSKISRGSVVARFGEEGHITYMISQGLRPIVGDVLVAIDDTTVLHLNSAQVQRFIVRVRHRLKQQILREQSFSASDTASIATSRISMLTDRKIKVTFRRYYVNDVNDIVRHDNRARLIQEERLYKEAMEAALVRDVSAKLDKPEAEGAVEAKTPSTVSAQVSEDAAEGVVANSVDVPPAVPVDDSSIACGSESKQDANTTNEAPVMQKPSAPRPILLSQQEVEWDHEAARIDLVCRTCTSKEVYKGMADLRQQVSADEVLPNAMTLRGTCQVQVLRSCGPWSVGHSLENSILNCWIQTIQNAKHFIYIENQFFIGDLAGTDIKNGIARALLDRLVLAAQREEHFKAIVLVPMHPEGDYISSSGPRGVMNYQYKTICRGAKSLIEQFKMATRGSKDPMNYICFTSLRNWGQLDDKVMFDQIYVHDKLLIVDDRVMIMGSANINDRSMLGDRDTEMAIRIEDTAHVNSSMDGEHFVVGIVPHMFRKKLMAKHCDDHDTDFSDPICDHVYHDTWLRIALANTALYDELDGPLSYEKCFTVEEYEKALAAKPFLDANDPLVESFLVRIKGHLVMWPLRFLEKENMLSAATKVLASDLFA